MEDLGVLLVTANIGSLSDHQPGQLQQGWIQELYKTIQHHRPAFIALHLQEVGGKNYKKNMDSALQFIRELMQGEELSAYDRTIAFIDSDFSQPHLFTALGSVYFIHHSVCKIHIYDFQEGTFVSVPAGQSVTSGSLEDCPIVHKERFPQDFWSEFPWTRKGFMRTTWQIDNRTFDLVNLHLFHDASNFVSYHCSPSVYSANRKKALDHILTRLQENSDVPFFLFGDFNFRLDLNKMILEQGWDLKTRNDSDGKTIEYEQDGEVRLIMKSKRFEYHNVKILQEDSGRALLMYDFEPLHFHSGLTEMPISFPPSYPFSEVVTRPSEFMGTRCPAWCDRVFMSHSARDLLNKEKDGKRCVWYDRIGADVCMGDHKPVFLYFDMEVPSKNLID
ncbi:type I inositol 1,4,5-trisphosphate 5-phosphatase-like [Pelobates cultripes]|uniref:inositol-polyphosphate 5-phosphatase n=1 Tax=Pelobates cultripes TaxID=61616 RepID=A0AAD1RQK9_PELCU|nr:type I inositol 1,4,5-trisphosphate 5-phosphatase-like [Pelobates cultripes]